MLKYDQRIYQEDNDAKRYRMNTIFIFINSKLAFPVITLLSKAHLSRNCIEFLHLNMSQDFVCAVDALGNVSRECDDEIK